MDFNPHAKALADTRRELETLVGRQARVVAELEWYTRFDPDILRSHLQTHQVTAQGIESELRTLERHIAEDESQIDETASRTGTLLNPRNWFAKDQVALRRRRGALRKSLAEKVAERESRKKDLASARGQVTKCMNTLDRFDAFEPDRKRRDLAALESERAAKREEFEAITARKQRVDEVLAPLLREVQALDERFAKTQSELEEAERLEGKLSSASNSYQRAMSHQECERTFNDGSPARVCGKLRRDLTRLEQDREKLVRRLEEISRRAARVIETIVIDGNNLCYEGRTFVGLSVIEAISPLLAKNHGVVVVFNSSISRLMNTNDGEIKRRLNGHAKVHVVSSGHAADDTLLDVASNDESTYVLSNDRFVDFPDKAAVRQGRVIRCEIVQGQIMIHDLQLRAAYR